MTEGVFLLGTERDGTQAIARFRTHSGAKTACGALSAGERRQTVENCSFPAFSTRKSGVSVLWKTQDFFFPIWRGTESSAGTNCKKKRKSFDFLLYKRQSAHFSSQKLAWIAGLHYGLYKQNQISMWKTRWKKWKTSWETGPFFHKISGKPGGKSEKFSPEWKNTTLFCCEMGRSAAAFCCNGLSFSPSVCTPRRSACFFLNALSNHGTITSDKREPSTSGGMMHEQLAEQVGA